MGDLVDFTKHVEEQLLRTTREPHWEPGEVDRYMADVEVRRRRFDELAVALNEQDRLTLMLGDVSEDRVADWVEERLLEFLDAYLRIDRGGEEFEDEAATDPVCGMRISRSSAAASDAYLGHPYYFCSASCQEKFSREPKKYVQVKTM